MGPVLQKGIPLAKVTEETIHVDGCPLHVRRSGEGRTLLYLHGAHGMGSWNPFFDTLAAHGSLWVPDHPGFGKSQPRGPVDVIADLAYVYLDLIEQAGLSDVHVIGHCIGGWTALEMAVRQPGAISGLTLLNSAGVHVDKVPVGDFFMATIDKQPNLLFADVERGRGLLDKEIAAVDDVTMHANRIMAARLSWSPRLFDPKLERWLKRIKVPASVLWGDSNKVFPLAYGEALARLVPNASLSVVKNAGHHAHLEQPAATAETIIKSARLS